MEIIELTLDALHNLPSRERATNKGSYGRLGVIAGCALYRGAPYLAISAALRCGVGIITLCSTERVVAAVASRIAECTYQPLCESASGGISRGEIDKILATARSCSAVLCGCGMGTAADADGVIDTAEITLALIKNYSGQLILDADALNAIAISSRVNMLASCARPPIITPHIGEMARLCGTSIEDIKRDRAAAAYDFAQKYNCIVVLKDEITHISEGGDVYVSRFGCSGLARGGSGDTLAGMISALAAQQGRGITPIEAAKCATVLHGKAAELAAADKTEAAMLPSDLPNYFGNVAK